MIESLLAKKPLYPLVCVLFSAASLIGGLLVAKRPAFVLLLACICVLYVCFGYAAPFAKCLRVILPVCAVVCLVALLAYGRPWDLPSALRAAGRIFLLGMCATPMISLPPVNLTRCLTQLRFPRALTLGMLVAVRFVPSLVWEIARIAEAMRTRGVRLALNPSCFYRAFLVPFVMRLIGISDVLALSLETRGFDMDGDGATVYRPVRFGVRDGVFCAAAAIAGGFVAYAAVSGAFVFGAAVFGAMV